ncbi:uncharacterized protein METZ01_LOCUS391105, partial [marine metagenome]
MGCHALVRYIKCSLGPFVKTAKAELV